MNEIIVFCLGVFLGLATGFVPGMHSNTIVAALSSIGMRYDELTILVIALFPAHIVASFIPAIFFGIPEENTVIAVLPGHRMVLDGHGIAAIKVVLLSCLFAGLLSVALFATSLGFFPAAYSLLRSHMKYVLLALSVFFITRSKDIPLSLLVFAASGLLGIYSLNSQLYDPFLPLFSGMFAVGAMLNYRQRDIPKQKEEKTDFSFVRYTAVAVIFGAFADLIPGFGSPSQVAAFMTLIFPLNTLGFLAATAGITVSEGIFSFATAASIGKSRVGTTAWLSRFTNISNSLPMLLLLFMVSLAIAVAVLYLLRKRIASFASINFSKANILLVFYLLLLSALLDGGTGVMIFFIASALGWVTVRLGVERTILMGAVIVPTILLLFGMNPI